MPDDTASQPPSPPHTRLLLRAWAWIAPVLLFAVALAVLAVGIAELPVIDRDEARFAQASRQMAESGDLIDIRFQDAPRHNKPVGIYWIHTGLLWAFDAAETREIWIFRLASVISAALACVALAWAGRPLVGRWPALMAGIGLASLFLVQAEARVAKTDAALLLTVILAMGALARAWMRPVLLWPVAAIFWTALAAGFLIKGPVILLPVLGVMLWASLYDRSPRWLLRLRPLYGALWALALVLPWYAAITWVTGGAFLSASLLGDLGSKLVSGQESHGAPPGSYLLALWVTFWPWGILLPLAATAAWAQRKSRALAFLFGWVLPAWLVFELVPTKLLHYPLPFYPALLLLCAAAIWPVLRGETPWRGWALYLGLAGWALGALVLWALSTAGPWVFGSAPSIPSLLGTALAVALAFFAVKWILRGTPRRGLAGLAASALVSFWTLFAVALPSAEELWVSQRLTEATARHSCLTAPMILVGYSEPSAVFLLGTDLRFTSASKALAALDTPGQSAWIEARALETEGLPPAPPGVADVSEVTGLNYSNGQDVTLRLYVTPGVPAPEQPCEP